MESLDLNDISKLSSYYISNGLKEERWHFKKVSLDDNVLYGNVAMDNFFISPQDPNGFHLSFLTAHEIIAQGTIILLHKIEGLDQRCRETWVSEVSSQFIRPIRNHKSIQLQITSTKTRKKNNMLISDLQIVLCDDLDGLFKSKARAWLA